MYASQIMKSAAPLTYAKRKKLKANIDISHEIPEIKAHTISLLRNGLIFFFLTFGFERISRVNSCWFQEINSGEEDKATKDEYKVAKWLKKNVPVKKTKFLYHNVEYFTGSKAVDALLASKFAETLFSTRQDVVEYLDKYVPILEYFTL